MTRSKEKGVEPTVCRIEGIEVADTWRNHLIAYNKGEKIDVCFDCKDYENIFDDFLRFLITFF